MRKLDDYRGAYRCIALEREEGVLHVRLHSDGKTLLWNDKIHWELVDLFYNMALLHK